MEKKQKEQTIEKVLQAIEQRIVQKKLRQKEVLALCEARGYDISQSELSRILSRKITLGLYQALVLCDVLDIDIGRLGEVRGGERPTECSFQRIHS